MDRLAIFGWTRTTPALVTALAEGAGLEAGAVGDERPAALARARGVLGVPCFHHIHEMARVATFDVALIGAVDGAAEIAEAVARRGADLLLDGASADGETLSRAAAAASRYDVGMVVLRPWLRACGLPAITAKLAAAPADLLLIDAVEDRPAMSLVRDLVALAARIAGADLLDVAASRVGSADEPAAIALQLRLADERVASITARRGEQPALRLVATGAGISVMLRREGDTTTIQGTLEDGSPAVEETHVSDQTDLPLAEARRVPEARAGGSADALLAAGEGAMLTAIERALEQGFAQHLEARARPALRLLQGGGHTIATGGRRGALTLVPR
jgi:hypothetical protein